MEKRSVERRARLLFFMTIFTVAIAGGAWYLYSESRYSTYQVLTRDNVSGLTRDDPVEFHGVQVGKVVRVELLDPSSVRVVIDVKKDAPISAATRAAIVSRGLSPRGFTGYVSIALENFGEDTRKISAAPGERFPTIPAIPPRNLSLDVDIGQATELIHSLLDQATVQSLKQSVQSIREITTTLAENNAKLSTLISNSERASKQLAPLLQSSNDSINALQTQVLPEAYKALSDLEDLTSALAGTAEEIARNPSVLVRGRTKPEPAPGETK